MISDLKGIDYDLIENVKTYITGKSRISYSWRKMRADLILYEKNIIVLPYNYHFKGFIKQYQPILQYTFKTETQKLNGVSSLMQIDKIIKNERKLFLNYILTDNILKGETEIELDFSENEYEINNIIEKKKVE